MTENGERVEIQHTPTGTEHPYEQEPTERFPRQPQALQPVMLGAATTPAGAARSVWATWQIEGTGRGGMAAGHAAQEERDRSIWKVTLPAFDAGQRVVYRLHAEGLGGEVASQPFSFFVSEWCEVGEVVARRLTADGLVLMCATTRSDVHARFILRFRRPDWLHLELSARAGGVLYEGLESADGPAGGAPYSVIENSPNRLALATEALGLIVHLRPCKLEIHRPNGTVLVGDAAPLRFRLGEFGRVQEVRQVFASPPDEAFYGFGERFNALDQRGNTLDVRVFEQYKDQGRRTYIPVPFLLSSLAYGLYLDTSRLVRYDLAASAPDRWWVSAEAGAGGELSYELICGATPKETLSSFASHVGRPSLPPIWAFGPWMSANEWNSQGRVMQEVTKTLKYGIPATVLVIEAWSDESTFYIWNDAQYRPKPTSEAFSLDDFSFPKQGKWSNPKAMIDELHALGIRVILWQVPILKRLDAPHAQRDADEAHMVKKGYYVRESDGSPYRIRPLWFHEGLALDFTNAEAADWWLRKRAYLLDELDIDGFKTDGGEHLWGEGVQLADGRIGVEAGNVYPNEYVGAYHRYAKERKKGDAVTFSRSGFTGAQAFPCHWAGDENSTWGAFRASILAGLNAGLSGIPFWGWDLGGFSGEVPSSELYLRAAAMAAFCPILQYHSEYNHHREPSRDRTPWNIQDRSGDADVIPVYRKFANIHMNLLPYLYSEAWKSSRTGLPLMRALPLEFPSDRDCLDYPTQYMLGESLLVAPVVEPGRSSWKVYLPPGHWHQLWDGVAQDGPGIFEVLTPRDVIPVYVRGGAILPVNLGEGHELGDAIGNAVDRYQRMSFMVYPYRQTSYEWFDGITSLSQTIECSEDGGSGQIEVGFQFLSWTSVLLVHGYEPASVQVADQALAGPTDFAMWSQSEAEGWSFHAGRGITFLRVVHRSFPLTVRILSRQD